MIGRTRKRVSVIRAQLQVRARQYECEIAIQIERSPHENAGPKKSSGTRTVRGNDEVFITAVERELLLCLHSSRPK